MASSSRERDVHPPGEPVAKYPVLSESDTTDTSTRAMDSLNARAYRSPIQSEDVLHTVDNRPKRLFSAKGDEYKPRSEPRRVRVVDELDESSEYQLQLAWERWELNREAIQEFPERRHRRELHRVEIQEHLQRESVELRDRLQRERQEARKSQGLRGLGDPLPVEPRERQIVWRDHLERDRREREHQELRDRLERELQEAQELRELRDRLERQRQEAQKFEEPPTLEYLIALERRQRQLLSREKVGHQEAQTRLERLERAKYKAGHGENVHRATASETDSVHDPQSERQLPQSRESTTDQAQADDKRGLQGDHSSHGTIASDSEETSGEKREPQTGEPDEVFSNIDHVVRFALRGSKARGVSIRLRWTFFQALEGQFGKGDIKVESIVTLTGSVLRAQATTCGDYIRTTWPRHGPFFIRLLQGLWDSYRANSTQRFSIPVGGDGSQIVTGDILGTRVTMEVIQDKDMIRKLVQMLAWAGAAISSSDDIENVAYCHPDLTVSRGVVELDFQKRSLPANTDSCWIPLFSGASIAYDFPIPRRQDEVGLEIPLQILAALLGAVRAVEYDGGVVIKGFSSMIIPTERTGEIVQWHLVANANFAQRLSYRDGLERCPRRALMDQVDFECLQKTRAVLGWCSATRCLLGSRDADYGSIDYSGAKEAGRSFNFAGGTLGFQQFGVAQLDFTLGPKDGKCHFQRTGPYQRIVSAAEKTLVVLYDTSDERGWLVPASEVILHMCHHRNQVEPFEIGGSAVLLPCTKATGQSAKKILLENASLDLCDPSFEKYTLRDLILNYWSLLEFLLDQNVRRDQASGNAMHMPLHEVLQGYEYRSVVEERSPFRTKQTTLRRTCGGWPALVRDVDALVLFASGFEDILRPLKDDQFHHVCLKWRSMPKEHSYLATTVKILQDLYEVAGNRLHRQYLTSTQLQWVQGASMLFEPCTSPGTFRCDCVRLQKIGRESHWHNRAIPPAPVLDGLESGAVIFGQSFDAPTRTRPASNVPSTKGLYSQPNSVFVHAEDREPPRGDPRGSTNHEHRFPGDTISASRTITVGTALRHSAYAGVRASSVQSPLDYGIDEVLPIHQLTASSTRNQEHRENCLESGSRAGGKRSTEYFSHGRSEHKRRDQLQYDMRAISLRNESGPLGEQPRLPTRDEPPAGYTSATLYSRRTSNGGRTDMDPLPGEADIVVLPLRTLR
ncbi:uncharacterized protein PV07_00300 [Cladophialophora immunda]|uniref:Uncharacterized protein n=1 Tax=Cladophialophora immunda TaxID=569365 RepID=A0A0D2CQH0_9EURO|nr:uncharacterized protein PV07_00300 [Cladophialophora immunda]KIW33448.1 hypothetical protein PV07_00300 [Cladophialophora immunda]